MTNVLEELTPEQLIYVLDKMVSVIYVMLACFTLYFLARIIPSILEYKAIRYLEIRMKVKREDKKDEKPLISDIIKKIKKFKKKDDDVFINYSNAEYQK